MLLLFERIISPNNVYIKKSYNSYLLPTITKYQLYIIENIYDNHFIDYKQQLHQ